MNTDVMTGAWTTYSVDITPEEREIFNKALSGLVGVQYSPIAVATQVVEGTNYSYFCNAKPVYPNAPNMAVMVTIYQPINGQPHIVSIRRCE